MINSHFFQNWEGKKSQLCEQTTCLFVSGLCDFDFQKRKQLHFLGEIYLNYTKKTKFCM